MPNTELPSDSVANALPEVSSTAKPGDNLDSARLPIVQNGEITSQSGLNRDYEKGAAGKSHYIPELILTEPGKTVRETTTIDGMERQYFLHLPKDYDASKQYPLVMVFNGWGNHTGQGGVPGGAEGMEKTTGLSEKADQEGFIVAYMDGSPRDQHSWNNGEWFFSKENDVQLTRNVMDTITQNANVDQSRIYLAGYSQGGSFAHKAATELSDRIAAVATVGGWLTGLEQKPTEPVSVLEIHAGKDPTVPYNGRIMWCTMKPHEYLKNFYLQSQGMTGEPETTTETTPTGFKAVTQDWKNPANGAEVKMISLPDVDKHEYYGGFGATVNPVDTTTEFLKFFKNHQRTQIQPGDAR